MRQKRIAIIGNANVSKDYSDFIDSCEVVIRLNLRIGLPTLAHDKLGEKTDILCYAPRAARLVLHDWVQAGKLMRFAEQAKRIWFVSPKLWYRVPSKDIVRFLVRNKRLVFDSSASIVKVLQLEHRQIEYFSHDFRKSVEEKLQIPDGNGASALPSAGMVVIQRVLEDPEFESYQKCVVGFAFSGWQGHPFALEKRLVESHRAKGLLQLLPVD